MTTLIQVNPAGGAAPGTGDDDADGYVVGSFWFHGDDIYHCTDDSTGAAVWKRLPRAPDVIIDSNASVNLALTHKDAILVLTNATPALTIPPQSSVTFPASFSCTVLYANDGTLIGGTGVDILGATAETFDVTAAPNMMALVRIGSDDWLAGGDVVVAP